MTADEFSHDAQQPGLRSFVIYDELPPSCIAFEDIEGESFPHIRKGELAVVDTRDRELDEGEMYLIQWQTSSRATLAGLTKRWVNICNPDRSTTPRELWFVGSFAGQQLITIDGKPCGDRIRFMDGPYEDEYVRNILLGRVIGIYAPGSGAAAAPRG